MFILLTRFGSVRTARDFDEGMLACQIDYVEKSLEYLIYDSHEKYNMVLDLASSPWRGYEMALLNHGAALIHTSWEKSGRRLSQSVAQNLCSLQAEARHRLWTYKRPEWTKDKDILTTHRSLLIRFNPEHYRPLFPGTPEDLKAIYSREELGAKTNA